MAVAFGAIGAKSAGGTTTISVAHPASVGAGDLLVAGRCLYQVAGIAATDESGWTAGGKLRGGTGTSADNHATMAAADYKEAAGGETGSVTFDQGGTVAGALGLMARYTKGSGVWEVAAATGDDATHAADRSVTSSTTLALAPGDVLVAIAAVDTDAALTITSPTFTASGITFGTVNRRTSGAGVLTGNDGNIEVFDVAVSTGTATVAVTFAFTTATTQCGPVSFLRLRETTPTQQPASGTVAGTSAVIGSSTLRAEATGSVGATSAVTGSAAVGLAASGTVAAASAASASSVLTRPASGTIAATSAASASPSALLGSAGTTAATSATSGAAEVLRFAAGTVAASSDVTGAASSQVAASGTVAASTDTSATAGLSQPTEGTVEAQSDTTGDAGYIGDAAGQVDATSDTYADPTALIGAEGTADATSTVGGSADVLGGPVSLPASGVVTAETTVTGEAGAQFGDPGTVDGISGAVGSASSSADVPVDSGQGSGTAALHAPVATSVMRHRGAAASARVSVATAAIRED